MTASFSGYLEFIKINLKGIKKVSQLEQSTGIYVQKEGGQVVGVHLIIALPAPRKNKIYWLRVGISSKFSFRSVKLSVCSGSDPNGSDLHFSWRKTLRDKVKFNNNGELEE